MCLKCHYRNKRKKPTGKEENTVVIQNQGDTHGFYFIWLFGPL